MKVSVKKKILKKEKFMKIFKKNNKQSKKNYLSGYIEMAGLGSRV